MNHESVNQAVAAEAGVEYLGFSLLSAGNFRGPRSRAQVLRLGLETVSAMAYRGLREVHFVALGAEERETLRRLMQEGQAEPGWQGVVAGPGRLLVAVMVAVAVVAVVAVSAAPDCSPPFPLHSFCFLLGFHKFATFSSFLFGCTHVSS